MNGQAQASPPQPQSGNLQAGNFQTSHFQTSNFQASPGGGVWAEMAGQTSAIATLQAAATAARHLLAGSQDLHVTRAMNHAWLIVGPPGSGRSVAARAFAAALQCTSQGPAGCGVCHACRTTMTQPPTHPNVRVLATDLVQLERAQVRDLVQEAYTAPTDGHWRVIIVEDYDRIDAASSNILLKAIEEPPAQTVWLLCAPSAADVIPTIRSRCRLLQLRIPSVQSVAELLVRRNGVDEALARQVAAEAGSHIGRAKGLALDPGARAEREFLLRLVVECETTTQAVWAAEHLVKKAQEQAKAQTERAGEQAKEQLLATLGADPSARTQPPHVRAELKRLEENQKRRSRRITFDIWDRLLEDLTGFYRDVLLVQVGAQVAPINVTLRDLVARLAQDSTAQRTGDRLEALRRAKERLVRNVSPALAFEALCIELLPHYRPPIT